MVSSVGSATTTQSLWDQLEKRSAVQGIEDDQEQIQQTVQIENELNESSGSDIQTTSPL